MEDMIQADPSGRLVLHVDLGLDKIFVWRFDDQHGVLAPNDPSSVSLPPGDGPRHFRFHSNGRWLYSIQEEGSTIVLFDYDSASGRLRERQTISTLPVLLGAISAPRFWCPQTGITSTRGTACTTASGSSRSPPTAD
jgi:6-phosphogluconolactonase (cycloisomerase 2 family)